MILVDTSVWVDHFSRRNDALADLLGDSQVLCHPFIVGELACGNLKRRSEILGMMRNLPETPLVEHHEVLAMIERHRLAGSGIGWIDAHLLASTLLAGTYLWTLDRPLAQASRKVSVLATP